MAPALGSSPTVLIETRRLARSAQLPDTPLLHPTDFHLHGADRVAITGASGSGKSVFLRLLALLDPASDGQLLWRGQTVNAAQVPLYRRHVCYLPQRPALLDGSVESNLRFPFSLTTHRQQRFDPTVIDALLAQSGKTAAFLAKDAAELSGGEAQIVALLRALQLAPEVLLLDEPTAALDPASVQAIETLVANWLAHGNGSRAYVWVSHDAEQTRRVSNRVLQMQDAVLTEAGL